MTLLFDYELDQKLSNLTESICHTDCKECKDAETARLESRVAFFHREKRSREQRDAEKDVWYDALEEEYYPFGIKHHPNYHNTIRLTDSDCEKDFPNPKEIKKSSPRPSKRKPVVLERSSPPLEDELTKFYEKLRDGTAFKKRRTVPAPKKDYTDYYNSIANVDLATLRAYPSYYSRATVNERTKDTQSAEPDVPSGPPSTANVVEVPKEDKPTDTQVSAEGIVDITSAPDDATPHPVEIPEAPPASPEPVAIALIEEEPAKGLTPPESEENVSRSIFGTSTLEKLNLSMPVGNPLFAPKVIDATQFSLPKAPPTFVFGAQPAPSVVTAAQPSQFQQMQAPISTTVPPPGTHFNIPGFTGVQLGQPMANAPNAFAANAFPKSKRGIARLRSGRR